MSPQEPSKNSDSRKLEDATTSLRQQREKLHEILKTHMGPLPASNGVVKIDDEKVLNLPYETDRLFPFIS